MASKSGSPENNHLKKESRYSLYVNIRNEINMYTSAKHLHQSEARVDLAMIDL